VTSPSPAKPYNPPVQKAEPIAQQPITQNKPLKKDTSNRKGSKFDLQQDEKTVLYRPEFKYDNSKQGTEKMWELMKSYLGNDMQSIQR
jgi:hypothetical protein